MLEALLPTAGWYSLFSFFVFCHQLNAKKFQGGWIAYGFILSLFGFVGMLAGFAYLGMLAYAVNWWAPIPIFVVGTLFAGVAAGLLTRSIEQLTILSLLGFAAWPTAAYFMFTSIPGL